MIQRGWYDDSPYSRARAQRNDLAAYKAYADRAFDLLSAANRMKRDLSFLAQKNQRALDDVSMRVAALEHKLG